MRETLQIETENYRTMREARSKYQELNPFTPPESQHLLRLCHNHHRKTMNFKWPLNE